MKELPVLFLSFANDPNDPLAHLRREEEGIFNCLRSRAKRPHFFLEKHSIATKSQISNGITKNWNDIAIFHFSGHADPEELSFIDGGDKSKGLSQLLSLQKKVKLIFLNACSTYGHVEAYLTGGIPVVIGTSAPIGDRIAADFAIYFYEAICVEGVSIREAFHSAKGRVSLTHEHNDIGLFKINSRNLQNNYRGFREEKQITANSNELNDFKWGLYYMEESDLDWFLPYDILIDIPIHSRVNLTKSLTKAFLPHCREIQRLKKDEAAGEKINPGQYRASIVKCLPSPLGDYVSKVFKESPKIPNQASQPKISQIVDAYNILMELMGFSMLAQLWKAYSKNYLNIKEIYKRTILNFFLLTPQERKRYNFLPLIRTIRHIFDDNKIEYFVDELEDLREMVISDLDFIEAQKFMESMKWLLANNRLSSQSILNNYLTAEKYLDCLLHKLSFCAKYRLTSIKNINLILPRHKKLPVYDHHLVPLIACGTYEVDKYSYEDHTHSHSVILLKSLSEVEDFLTITPFIIDANSYDDKSTISSIFFFEYYDPRKKSYVFSEAISNPQREKINIEKIDLDKYEDYPEELIEQQKYYNEIFDQFEAFLALFH